MIQDKIIDDIVEKVIKCAIRVKMTLATGYLEKVYEKALMIELKKAGLKALQQVPINVKYDNEIIGDYIVDILVEDFLVVELKAVERITTAHEAQVVNYLSVTGLDVGLIINFGNPKKIEFRRKYRVYRPKGSKLLAPREGE